MKRSTVATHPRSAGWLTPNQAGLMPSTVTATILWRSSARQQNVPPAIEFLILGEPWNLEICGYYSMKLGDVLWFIAVKPFVPLLCFFPLCQSLHQFSYFLRGIPAPCKLFWHTFWHTIWFFCLWHQYMGVDKINVSGAATIADQPQINRDTNGVNRGRVLSYATICCAENR